MRETGCAPAAVLLQCNIVLQYIGWCIAEIPGWLYPSPHETASALRASGYNHSQFIQVFAGCAPGRLDCCCCKAISARVRSGHEHFTNTSKRVPYLRLLRRARPHACE